MWKKEEGVGRELGVFCSVGVFPLPQRATLSHSSKRSYSPLLKRAAVLRNRRVGERRLESSRLVCPGIRFLPINWDWQGLSGGRQPGPRSGCASDGVGDVRGHHTRSFGAGKPGCGVARRHLGPPLGGVGLCSVRVVGRWDLQHCFSASRVIHTVRLFSQRLLAIKT